MRAKGGKFGGEGIPDGGRDSEKPKGGMDVLKKHADGLGWERLEGGGKEAPKKGGKGAQYKGYPTELDAKR